MENSFHYMENNEHKSNLTNASSILRTPAPSPQIPFCVRTLGKPKPHANHLTRGTYFDDVMLTCFTDGKGLFYYSGGRVKVSVGMIGLVLPEEGESYLKADTHEPYHHIYCRFAGSEAIKMARGIREIYLQPFFTHSRIHEVAGLLEQMISLGLPRDAGARPLTMKPVEALLAQILSILSEASRRPHRIVRKINRRALSDYILEHLSEPVSLERVSSHFTVSKSYFCRECKQLLGTSYQKAVEREKMVLAAALLRDPLLDINVSEAAYRSGYEDPLYFSKVFKRHYGSTPTAYNRT